MRLKKATLPRLYFNILCNTAGCRARETDPLKSHKINLRTIYVIIYDQPTQENVTQTIFTRI